MVVNFVRATLGTLRQLDFTLHFCSRQPCTENDQCHTGEFQQHAAKRTRDT